MGCYMQPSTMCVECALRGVYQDVALVMDLLHEADSFRTSGCHVRSETRQSW